MPNAEKMAERGRKAQAYRDLLRSLAGVSKVYQPTASSIFDSLSRARLNERNAESSRLARETLFGEDPQATLPEELSNQTISQYLANAGDLYGSAATDYVLMSDSARAFKYFRRAAQHCRRAANFQAENGPELREKAQQYKEQAAMVRQELAGKRIRRRRFSLRFLVGLGRKT